jgi:transcriptional regulator with XRE-family HTH domain
MAIHNSLKFFRQHRNIYQEDMTEKNKSNYSRLEAGKAKITEEMLKPLSDTLSISVSELILHSNLDNDIKLFQETIRKTMNNPDPIRAKKAIIKLYSDLKKIRTKNNKQLAEYFTIIINFSGIYEEVKAPTKEEIQTSFLHLIDLSYHTQYDYLLAFNTCIYYTSNQLHTLIKTMFPIEDIEQRTVDTLKYANNLLTNIINMQIYNLEYEKVLEYIQLVEKQDIVFETYYYRFLLTYYKNLTLFLMKRENKYLSKIECFLEMLQEMNDLTSYKAFKQETQNLTENPRYYLDLQCIESMTLID